METEIIRRRIDQIVSVLVKTGTTSMMEAYTILAAIQEYSEKNGSLHYGSKSVAIAKALMVDQAD